MTYDEERMRRTVLCPYLLRLRFVQHVVFVEFEVVFLMEKRNQDALISSLSLVIVKDTLLA